MRCLLGMVLSVGTLGLAACSPVGALNALTPRHTYVLQSDIAYGSVARQRLDVYVPRQAAGTANTASTAVAGSSPTGDDPARGVSRLTSSSMPIVVFVYGGSWQNGDRADYRFAGEALASAGFVTVIPDYRVYPETIFPGFVEDAAAAVAWARAHAADYGADPRRLFLVGHSAGAQIVALLATDNRYLHAQGLDKSMIAGLVGLAGPYDFLPLQDDTLKKVFPLDRREASQPIHFVDGREPPVFLGVGNADKTVDPGNTERFAARLEQAGDRVTVRHYPKLNHALTIGVVGAPLRFLAPVRRDVVSFIRQTSAALP
ncbi:alpha/beta hydrolase [Robbsia sp. KACC 23696]|uniref:alpha/beta hydrolase n=1 Tax=Robbsia sp. KACC 23696 TaxID=3149231 RepID=UPI00325B2D1F